MHTHRLLLTIFEHMIKVNYYILTIKNHPSVYIKTCGAPQKKYNMLLVSRTITAGKQDSHIDYRRLIFDENYRTIYQRDIANSHSNYFYFKAITGIKKKYSRKNCDVTASTATPIQRSIHSSPVSERASQKSFRFSAKNTTLIPRTAAEAQRIQTTPRNINVKNLKSSTLELSPAKNQKKSAAHYNIIKLNRKMFKIHRINDPDPSSQQRQTSKSFKLPENSRISTPLSQSHHNKNNNFDLEFQWKDEASMLMKEPYATISAPMTSSTVRPRLEEVMNRHKEFERKYRMSKKKMA